MTSSGGVRARAGQRAGVHEAIGHHAVERRGDGQVSFQFLAGLDHGLCGGGGLAAGAHQLLRRIHLLFRQNQLVAGHGAGRFGGLLETIVECSGRRQVALPPGGGPIPRPALWIRLRRSGSSIRARSTSPEGRPVSPCCRGRPERARRSRAPWRAARRSGTAGARREDRRFARRAWTPPAQGRWFAQRRWRETPETRRILKSHHNIGSQGPSD